MTDAPKVDLNKLSPAALKAALTGGTESWGRFGSIRHVRYAELISKGEKRRRCRCGCNRFATHRGKANGVALCCGCELSIRRWVVDPIAAMRSGYRQDQQRKATRLRAKAARLLEQAAAIEVELMLTALRNQTND
jgi:hypothetical protein